MDLRETKVVEMVVKFNGKELKGTPAEFKLLRMALEEVFGKPRPETDYWKLFYERYWGAKQYQPYILPSPLWYGDTL